MSWLDGIADEATLQNQRDSLQVDDQPLKPDLFTGSLGAIDTGITKGIVKLGDSLNQGIGHPKYSGQTVYTKDQYKQFDDDARNDLAKKVKSLTPDPNQVGTAGQILNSLGDVLPRTVMGSVMGGPLLAGLAAGAPEYDASKAVSMSEGIDESTASKKAAIDASVLGVGTLLPGGHIVKNLLGDAALTVGANVGLGMASRGATSALLESHGYTEQAAQYKAFDKTAVAIDLIMGAAFLGVARLTHKAPDVVNAALTENSAQHIETGTAVGAPVDAKSNQIHQTTIEESIAQLVKDEPVTVKRSFDEASFIRKDENAPMVSKNALAHYPEVKKASEITGVNSNLLIAQLDAESGGNVNAKSKAGAQGVSQFIPATAKRYGVDVTDPASSIHGQARYMSDLLKMFDGDNKKALAGYNAGEGNIKKAVKKFGNDWLQNLHLITSPVHAAETRGYVSKVMAKAGIKSAEKPTSTIQENSANNLNLVGNKSTAYTERGNKIETQYAVVEAENLITSHDNNLKQNQYYPQELQPRDRTRDASEAQISRIENAINPELLAESPKVSDGAPIIGGDGIVESGNARSIALRRAYENGKADNYREFINDNADRFGIDRNSLSEIKNPVLVRIRNSQVDRAEFTRQANESSVSTLSVTEQAKSDATRLISLDGMVAHDDGTINFNGSNTFVKRFMQDAVSPTEYGAMISGDGSLSKQGESRIKNAIFHKAYGDSEIVGLMAESTDANIKNILNGMLRAAPAVARLRDLIEAGARHPMDISPNLVKAVREFSDIRKNGLSIEQFLAQQNMFDTGITPEINNLLIGLQENSRAPKRIADMINSFVKSVDGLGDPRQIGMFDDLNTPKSQDILANTIESMRTDYAVPEAKNLFDTPELNSAKQVADLNPMMKVQMDDGNEVTVREAMAMLDDEFKQAENDSKAFDAAVTCFTRT